MPSQKEEKIKKMSSLPKIDGVEDYLVLEQYV